MQGQFITIDGVDGAGKGTQIDFIRSWFRHKEIELVSTREPGGTKIGESVRTQLLDVTSQMSLETETLLMFAARQQHIQEIIKPALEQGKWVLCDRFTDATYAYQGLGRGMPWDKIGILENWVQADFRPNLTILLDVPIEISYARVARIKDRIESESQVFFERVRNGYLSLAKLHPERYHVVSGYQPVSKVSADIADILQTFVSKVG